MEGSDPRRNESKKHTCLKFTLNSFLISTSHLSCIVAVDANTELMKHHLRWSDHLLKQDHRLNVDTTSHGMVLLQWTNATESVISAEWTQLFQIACVLFMDLLFINVHSFSTLCQHKTDHNHTNFQHAHLGSFPNAESGTLQTRMSIHPKIVNWCAHIVSLKNHWKIWLLQQKHHDTNAMSCKECCSK